MMKYRLIKRIQLHRNLFEYSRLLRRLNHTIYSDVFDIYCTVLYSFLVCGKSKNTVSCGVFFF